MTDLCTPDLEPVARLPYTWLPMTQSQPLTILFADVSGSTKLFEMRGDLEARRIDLRRCSTPCLK